MAEINIEIEEIADKMIAMIKADKRYPKLKHLAIHGKNRRIRRKNIKRLYKLWEFYCKNKYPYTFFYKRR